MSMYQIPCSRALFEMPPVVQPLEFPNILCNPKVPYRVHKSPPRVLIPSKIESNLYHPIISLHRRIGLHPSCYPNIVYAFLLTHSWCTPYPSISILLHHSNYTWRRAQGTKLLIMQFSPISWHFISLRSKYSPQRPVLIQFQSRYVSAH
jgi:hypothetical protein